MATSKTTTKKSKAAYESRQELQQHLLEGAARAGWRTIEVKGESVTLRR